VTKKQRAESSFVSASWSTIDGNKTGDLWLFARIVDELRATQGALSEGFTQTELNLLNSLLE